MKPKNMDKDSVKEIQTVYLTFVLVSLYYAISVASTSDKDLVLNTVIELPLIGSKIPIIWYYIIAPFLFLILHLNLFVQTWLLSSSACSTNGNDSSSRITVMPFPVSHLMSGSYVSAGNDVDTTVAPSSNTYDRIIITPATAEDYVANSAKVFLFDQLFELDCTPGEVSDHYPVFAEFKVEADTK